MDTNEHELRVESSTARTDASSPFGAAVTVHRQLWFSFVSIRVHSWLNRIVPDKSEGVALLVRAGTRRALLAAWSRLSRGGLRIQNHAMRLTACFSLLLVATAHAWTSSMVQVDAQGRLSYPSDASGNRIPDFSHAGYKGG